MATLSIVINKDDIEVTMVTTLIDNIATSEYYFYDPIVTDELIIAEVREDLQNKGYLFN